MNQPLSPKDERIVSTNPSVDVAITGPSRTVADQLGSSDVADSNQVHLLNSNASLEQTYYYGGYDSSNSGWSGYSQFSGAEGLHIVPPVIYGDNPSLGLHSPYSFNSQMAYGQYSPASIMVDNLLYSPQQIPASPYYPQPGASTMPHISAAIPVSHAELVAPRGNLSSNSAHSPGFYNVPMMFGSGEPLPSQSNASDMGWRTMSTMTSNAAYTPPIGTFGSYDPNVGQISQQRPFPGSGLVSDPVGGPYSYDDSFSSNYGMMPRSRPPNYRSWVNVEKGRSHREQDSAFVMSGDRNRGPRASKAKARTNSGNTALPVSVSTAEDSSLITAVVNASARGVNFTSFNSADFPTIYEKAKFFIIKSFSEDNVHRSIKYSVWASTPQGNRKLDAAYQEAKGKGDCPVFLFFSVNASAQFCGIAEMMGPVDFEKNADYWQQDRWSGQFPVRWHIVKDVPNSKFRHILLENNDNKPVTHSRDSQEVKLEQGIEMLKIFKNHDAQTSILDDFYYYDERERVLQERKTRQQQAKPKREASNSLNDELKNDISDRLDQALRLEETRTDISPRDKMGDPHQT